MSLCQTSKKDRNKSAVRTPIKQSGKAKEKKAFRNAPI